MVGAALDGLPEELGRLMSNVAVTVEHGRGPRGLLGLYEGIPLTSRTSQYSGVLPDHITIYRQAVCAICQSEDEVAEQLVGTRGGETGHHRPQLQVRRSGRAVFMETGGCRSSSVGRTRVQQRSGHRRAGALRPR